MVSHEWEKGDFWFWDNAYVLNCELNRADAKSILEKAEDVQANLRGSTDAQRAAQAAITQAEIDIGDAEQDLTQVSRGGRDNSVTTDWNYGIKLLPVF